MNMKRCVRRTASVEHNLLTPVKASIRTITRTGSKVWESLTGKKHSSKSTENEVFSQSLIQFSTEEEKLEVAPHSVSFHSGVSAPGSTDQKHYTSLTPSELAKIAVKPNPKGNNTEESSKLTYTDFGKAVLSSTPTKTVNIEDKINAEDAVKIGNKINGEASNFEIIPKITILENGHEIPGPSRIPELAAPVFDRSSLLDVYEEMEKSKPSFKEVDLREKFLKEKFVVNLHEYAAWKKTSPQKSPICKNRVPENSGLILMNSIPENDDVHGEVPLTPPISCKNGTDLNSAFETSEFSFNVERNLLQEPIQEYLQRNYDQMMQRRNQLCLQIRNISNALSNLRGTNQPNLWYTLLHAEKNLLKATETCRVVTDHMNKIDTIPRPPKIAGTIKISRIKIKLNPEVRYDEITYFVCLAIFGTTVLATRNVQPFEVDGEYLLQFNDDLVFENLPSNFKIHLKIYRIHLEVDNGKKKMFPRPTVGHPVKYFICGNRDGNSTRTELNTFLLPIHKQCGIFEINKKNYDKSEFYNYFPNSPLYQTASVTTKLTHIKMGVDFQGLLNFGQRYRKDEMIVWNIKHVHLTDYDLKIYNQPSDEEPLVKIDLRNLASELITHECHLKRVLQLDIVYDEDPDFDVSFKFPYFLRAYDRNSYASWCNQLNYVINKLKSWRLLPYLNKDINY